MVGLSPAPAEGRSTGANPGFAGHLLRSDGSPQTCAVCHNSFDLNAGTGSVSVEVAQTAAPGETVAHFEGRMRTVEAHLNSPAFRMAGGRGLEGLAKDMSARARSSRWATADGAWVKELVCVNKKRVS